MHQVVKVVFGVIGFAVLAVLLAFRIALAAVLAMVTPILMPILALLSGGGLLVAVVFACSGHWHDAVKGLWACFICSVAFALVASLVQLINLCAFSLPVVTTGK